MAGLARDEPCDRTRLLGGVVAQAQRPDPVPYPELVEEALCWGWIDSTVNTFDDDRGLQMMTPRKPKSTWTRLNRRRVAAMEEQGRMTDAGRRIIEVAQGERLVDDPRPGRGPDRARRPRRRARRRAGRPHRVGRTSRRRRASRCCSRSSPRSAPTPAPSASPRSSPKQRRAAVPPAEYLMSGWPTSPDGARPRRDANRCSRERGADGGAEGVGEVGSLLVPAFGPHRQLDDHASARGGGSAAAGR